MCNCIEEVSEKLKPHGCGLDVPLIIPRDAKAPMPPAKVAVRTYRLDFNKRKTPALVVASFCPFCGEKYPEAAKS